MTGPLPTLPAFPPNAAVPTPAQRLAIDAALSQADLLIAAFLGAGNHDAYLDAVFGNAQRAAALANFQAMRQVVGRWQNQTRDVYVSAWLTRFNRGATTNGATQCLTLPIADLANQTAPQLGRTIVHESAHGVSNAIIDMAYGGPAFTVMLGATRLYNAPHYDFTTNAFHAGTAPGAVAAGNPNAVAVAAGPGAQLAPAAGAQLGRAQMLITHARIHAENMLEEMVRCIRTGQTPSRSPTWPTGYGRRRGPAARPGRRDPGQPDRAGPVRVARPERPADSRAAARRRAERHGRRRGRADDLRRRARRRRGLHPAPGPRQPDRRPLAAADRQRDPRRVPAGAGRGDHRRHAGPHRSPVPPGAGRLRPLRDDRGHLRVIRLLPSAFLLYLCVPRASATWADALRDAANAVA